MSCLALLSGAACGCTGSAVPIQVNQPSVRVPVSLPPSAAAVEAEVRARINQYRASRGLPALAYDERVAEIARRHSQAMAAGRLPFGHDGFDQRAEEVGRLFAIRSMAENVAHDSRPDTAARVVEGWLDSSGHRANILGTHEVTGVGAARSPDGTYYLTQIFVARR